MTYWPSYSLRRSKTEKPLFRKSSASEPGVKYEQCS
jgi:hypothetical protein